MASWRALHRKAAQTTISISSHLSSVSFFYSPSQGFFLSWLEIQSLTARFGTASKIARNAKFISTSPDKVQKCLSWGTIEAHRAWGCIWWLKRFHINVPIHTFFLASGFIIFQDIIFYVTLRWHYLNKYANLQYVFQATCLLPKIFTVRPLRLLDISVQQSCPYPITSLISFFNEKNYC